jgi:hypothetical protein
MDIDDLGIYPIVYNYNVPLVAGQIVQNEIMQLCFDGSSWQLLSAINGDQSFSSVNVTGSTIPANGIYLPSANTVGISTNSTLRATVNSSGQFFVGSTSLPSDITSNQIAINAGLFRSASMTTASTASGTAVTIFALPTPGNGVYLIQASLFASADAPNYSAVGILVSACSGPTLSYKYTSLVTATRMSISVSGSNLQATQTSGASAVITATATRFA